MQRTATSAAREARATAGVPTLEARHCCDCYRGPARGSAAGFRGARVNTPRGGGHRALPGRHDVHHCAAFDSWPSEQVGLRLPHTPMGAPPHLAQAAVCAAFQKPMHQADVSRCDPGGRRPGARSARLEPNAEVAANPSGRGAQGGGSHAATAGRPGQARATQRWVLGVRRRTPASGTAGWCACLTSQVPSCWMTRPIRTTRGRCLRSVRVSSSTGALLPQQPGRGTTWVLGVGRVHAPASAAAAAPPQRRERAVPHSFPAGAHVPALRMRPAPPLPQSTYLLSTPPQRLAHTPAHPARAPQLESCMAWDSKPLPVRRASEHSKYGAWTMCDMSACCCFKYER
jgi:hypothetical protein